MDVVTMCKIYLSVSTKCDDVNVLLLLFHLPTLARTNYSFVHTLVRSVSESSAF